MNYSVRIQKALQRAALWHRDQVRKDVEKTPYIVHLVSVLLILAEFTDDEDVLIAGLFHDVLEDVDLKLADVIECQFGARVLGFVESVSEDKDPQTESDPQATWRERKLGYLAKITHDDKEALLISAADKVDNWEGMVSSVRLHGIQATEGFNASLDDRLWFAEEVAKLLRNRIGDHVLVQRLEQAVRQTKELISSLMQVELLKNSHIELT
jgi:(p)ppGpp synthase/HD superfamily hydrolase